MKSLVVELENLKDWLAANLAQELKKPPLSDDLATLQQLMDQDLEPDPRQQAPLSRRFLGRRSRSEA